MKESILNSLADNNTLDFSLTGTHENKSCEKTLPAEALTLITEIREMASFQNTAAWHSDSFTFDFQNEYIVVLGDKASRLEEILQTF
ncbi:hypothetical protein [Vibrio scophthalmi]|uniref:Uncharacterized protein n=1 Tax=Vibrio scophthalmi LMG 19158 TaxID=870967 RepID=F9RPY0_9VIBR|nr:hypothetical protein [Vibrio scophthalmi]EGU34932.1 hypothetical protein VIS19158_10839 [Vibrio scophthalmi LMG 19158]